MRYRFTRDDISIKNNHDGSLILSIMLDGKYIDHMYMGYSKKEAVQKFQQTFGTYPDDYKPAAVLPLCNHGGLAIMEVENGVDTYVYVTDNYGDGYKNITKNRIKYSRKDKPYFIRNNQRYYLSEFMRM